MSGRPRFSDRQRKRYLRSGAATVDGWLMTCDKFLIAALGEFQRAERISGGVCEIGVHHGKLFLLLYLYLHEMETAVAIDLFERQDLNIDHSGSGNRAVFLANIRAHAGSDAALHVIAGDSTSLEAGAITSVAGPIRLFSIDGGHTAAITRSDLALAESCLHDWGVIILDDCFNASWPGVSEGVQDYFRAGTSQLAPFAIARNKVFFCRRDKAAAYRAALRLRQRETLRCSEPFLGVDVDIHDGYHSVTDILAMTRLRALTRLTGGASRIWREGLDQLAFFIRKRT